MLNYNDDAEKIRKVLNCQYFFDEAPIVKKNEVPPCFARLDKKFEGFLDLPLSEKVKTGQDLTAQAVEKAIERKLTLTREVYPKLNKLAEYLYKNWLVSEYFPAEAKKRESIAQLKSEFEARKNGTFTPKDQSLKELKKEFQQDEKERYRLFVKFNDLLYNQKDLIEEICNSINKNFAPLAWWIFDRVNELQEAVAQHKKDDNADVDKTLIVDLLGSATLAKSLYWNAHFVENELQNIRGELHRLLSILQIWPDVEARKREANNEKSAKAINDVIQYFYIQNSDTNNYFAFFEKVLKIWDAEQMLARELKTVEPIVSLPDKIRENLQKLMNKAIRKAIDKNKLQPAKVLAEHYNLSVSAVYKWKGNGAPFHGNKASINELDQWFKKQGEKASQSAKNRSKKKS